MFQVTTLCLAILLTVARGQEYQGAFLGKLNTYAHQVSGEVYAIDEHTFLIKSFFYDGLGQDTFFWAGATIRPSNIGFLVPDETGKTNKLRRYVNQEITIRLPDEKKIKQQKWLAIWDLRDNRNFADIYIPEGFEPPSPQRVDELTRESHGVRSGPVVVVTSKQIRIPDFYYDGTSDHAFFMVGEGPIPNSQGKKIPNELGYLGALGKYEGETITLDLPGELTVFEVDWLAVWDTETDDNFGSISLSETLNIPPSLVTVVKKESRLPNCEQLHRNVQLAWDIFGPAITFEISAMMDDDEYVAFGLSGSKTSSKMVGADVAVSYMDGHLGHTVDYNVTDLYPCTNVLGLNKGVCPDIKMGGVDNFQIHTFFREDGITRLTYRRNLENVGDEGDQPYLKDEPQYVVWAIGKLNSRKEPRMHTIYPKRDLKLHFGRKSTKNCVPFNKPPELPGYLVKEKPWGPLRVINQTLTTFYARLGVPGDTRGYSGITGHPSPGLVWYVNGLMAPVIHVKRGRSYVFRVEGGNNPSNAYTYHPLYITNDPDGGYVKMADQERKKHSIYAGIDFDKKGRPSPTSAGRLCLWAYPEGFDARKSNRYATFTQFRGALNYTCDKGSPALLQWTPNEGTPDVVYYQSYTQRNMGGKIIVVDDFTASAGSGSPVAISFSILALLMSIITPLSL
ncbi:Protein Skeletor, isoforms B/C [Halotydeus destructor]|nr:Protein Skeletor, isoforms B/C [Halotydeus destructor]